MLIFPVGLAVPLPEGIRIHSLLTPAFTGPVLGVVCLLQFTVSLLLEKRYEKGFGRSLFWIIWYPLVYWLLSLLTTLVAFSKVMLKARRGRALDQPRSGHWEDQRMTDVLIYSERGLLPRVVDSLLTLSPGAASFICSAAA